MRHNGVVRRLRAGEALVEIAGGESCSGCSQKHACFSLSGGQVKTRKAWVENRAGAQPGDLVELELSTSSTISVILVTFLLPVATIFAGYLIGAPGGAGSGAIGALAGLVVGGLTALGLNRALGKRSAFRMSILRILERSGESEGGDGS